MLNQTKDPAVALAKQFEWLTSAMKKVGSEAQLRVANHLYAVTNGRHRLLPNYHNDPLIGSDVKTALYKHVFRACAGNGKTPNWSMLQGQAGNGSKRVDPIDVAIEPVIEAVKVVEAGTLKPVTASPIGGDSEVADLLAKLLKGRLAPENAPPVALDEERVETIADRCARSAVTEALLDADKEFEGKLKHHLGNGSFPTDRVQALIAEAMRGNVKTVSIILPSGEVKVVKGLAHEQFPLLLKMAAARVNLLITGPTGSGKTHAAETVAKALDLPFFYNGAIDTEYKLKGFIDAGGKLISPAFRKAWQNGGVYCFDEVDASLPPAVLSFNGALSNHLCDFPDGMVERHPNCVILATANTWLGGATFDYVGRMKQDAAFSDRFATLYWGIDEKLERALCGNKDWVKFVQAVRANIVEHGLKVIVSPRATFNGEKLLAAGIEREEVIKSCVKKGMSNDQWNQINPDK